MRFMLTVMISAVLITSCGKEYSDAPSCIKNKIRKMKLKSVRNPPGRVHEYEYKGSRVYLIPGDCCDQYDLLYDGNCNLICAPSGGFTGRGDMRCTDFYSQAIYIREVWKDSR